jgi:hypothetical protein
MTELNNAGMEDRRVEVEFKVAMDKEAAKNKEHETVVFTVVVKDEHMEDVVAAAVKSQVILWQGQIRNNWDKFMGDEFEMPEEVEFGQPLFGPKPRTTTRRMTEDEMIQELSKNPKAMEELLKKLQESMQA